MFLSVVILISLAVWKYLMFTHKGPKKYNNHDFLLLDVKKVSEDSIFDD